MNNYEYIIASLPLPGKDADLDADAILTSIREALSARDQKFMDCLTDSFVPEKMTPELYTRALSSGNSFLRDYLSWDLGVRNTKVEYLNQSLGRPEGTDVVEIPGLPGFEGHDAVASVLATDDILARERGLDELMWSKAEELASLHVLDLDVILSIIVKLKINDRWNKLDPSTGRSLFRRLVDEIRQTR